VTAADDHMLLIEYRIIMGAIPDDNKLLVAPSPAIELSVARPWSPRMAERRFLRRFKELCER
jgi:hypothetical protein